MKSNQQYLINFRNLFLFPYLKRKTYVKCFLSQKKKRQTDFQNRVNKNYLPIKKYTEIILAFNIRNSDLTKRRKELSKEKKNPFIALQRSLLRIRKQVNCWFFWYLYLLIFRWIASINLSTFTNDFSLLLTRILRYVYLHFCGLSIRLDTRKIYQYTK